MKKRLSWHMNSRRVISLCAGFLLSSQSFAQTYYEEQGQIRRGTLSVATQGPNVAGDSVDLYMGTVQLSRTDIDLPGNNALKVSWGRRLNLNERPLLPAPAWWAPEIPHIHGTFGWGTPAGQPGRGWVTQYTQNHPNRNKRCTYFGPPLLMNAIEGNGRTVDPFEYWDGHHLTIPGEVSELLLSRNASNTFKPDTGVWPIVTKSHWQVSCIPLVVGAGEGFLALSPSGTRYQFDRMVQRSIQSVTGYEGTTARVEIWILPSLITDRFGNTVTYSYDTTDPWRVTSIVASDGRRLNFVYAGDGSYTVTAYAVDTTPRTWQYSATGNLVTLPDGSQWSYSIGSYPNISWQTTPGCTGAGGTYQNGVPYSSPTTTTIATPSGATVSLVMDYVMHGQAGIDGGPCFVFGPYNGPTGTFPVRSIKSKTITGPGLPGGMTWQYVYGPPNGGGVCEAGCVSNKTVTVIDPEARQTRYTFGNEYTRDGELRQIDEGWNPGTGTALKTTANIWISLPITIGTSFKEIVSLQEETIRGLQQKTITQQGVTMTYFASVFDTRGRPTTVSKYSTLGPSRIESLAYDDKTSPWVLGQLKSVTEASTGLKPVDNDYDALGNLSASRKFSAVVGNYVYNPDGTLASHTDGRGLTTWFGNYKLGIPRLVTYADSTTESAVVNDLGQIASRTDQNGFTTSFTYNSSALIASIAYPTGDTTVWNSTVQSFGPVASVEYGIAAGHWTQTVSTGNGVKIRYFDALWRPLVSREYDAGNVAGTQRFQRFSYDSAGRTTFASYPGSTDALTAGNRTQFDAMGRVSVGSQDSELGVLSTTTDYLTGYQVRVTNPRGFQTTTDFQVFDEPSFEAPVRIAHPAGAFTHITRDVFGKPTRIRRSDSSSPTGGVVALDRYYVYDPTYQRLCKSIEPETGATVQEFDAAGNLSWSASGLNLPSTTSCNLAEGQSSGRAVTRSYSLRNQLSTLSFPDGRGNQSWSYTPDGLPSSITTNNVNAGEQVVNGYGYNRRRMLTSETSSLSGFFNWSAAYGFDANGSLSTLTYPTGLVVSQSPNALGQPTQLTDQYGTTYASGVSYYPNGAVASFTYGNGIAHTMTQNARQLPSRSTDGGVLDLGYSFDANGNVGQITDYIDGSQSRGLSYDSLDRLTQATSIPFGTATYAFDVLDNLTRATVGASTNYPARDLAYCYDSAWRLSSLRSVTCGGGTITNLSYDVQGNLASKGAQSYSFDFGNRLRSTPGQEAYRYDGYGRRVTNTLGSGNIFSFYSSSGQILFAWNQRTSKYQRYVFLAGSLLAVRESPLDGSSTVVSYQHTDALGSPIATTNSGQGLLNRTVYEPFGAQVNRALTDGPGYTGHIQDAATGLTYMQQRYYDPIVGRFLSVDPVTAYDQPSVSFNRYWYGNNNPYRVVDPDGRLPRQPCILGPPACQQIGGEEEASEKQKSLDAQSPSVLRVIKQYFDGMLLDAFGFIDCGARECSSGQWASSIGAAGLTYGFPIKGVGSVAARTMTGVPGRVLSRINISNSRWAHVVGRHFGGSGSQFSIGQSELRALLGSKQVVGSPVLRTLEGPGGTQYLRQIEMGQVMGVDKFTGTNTSTLTVITDAYGNLASAFPGILR